MRLLSHHPMLKHMHIYGSKSLCLDERMRSCSSISCPESSQLINRLRFGSMHSRGSVVLFVSGKSNAVNRDDAGEKQTSAYLHCQIQRGAQNSHVPLVYGFCQPSGKSWLVSGQFARILACMKSKMNFISNVSSTSVSLLGLYYFHLIYTKQ